MKSRLTRSGDRAAMSSRRVVITRRPRLMPLIPACVRGHEKVRTFGHEKSALVATRSPQFWP